MSKPIKLDHHCAICGVLTNLNVVVHGRQEPLCGKCSNAWLDYKDDLIEKGFGEFLTSGKPIKSPKSR